MHTLLAKSMEFICPVQLVVFGHATYFFFLRVRSRREIFISDDFAHLPIITGEVQ